MKKVFRIEVENKTSGDLHILPLDRTLLPRTREVFEAEFSRPLRLRLARLEQDALKTFYTTIGSLFKYNLDFKHRGLRFEWVLKVKNGGNNGEPGMTAPPVTCVVAMADEEPPKNVEPGEPD